MGLHDRAIMINLVHKVFCKFMVLVLLSYICSCQLISEWTDNLYLFKKINYRYMHVSIIISHFSALHYLCRHGQQDSTVRHEIAYKLLYAGLSADCVDNRGREL